MKAIEQLLISVVFIAVGSLFTYSSLQNEMNPPTEVPMMRHCASMDSTLVEYSIFRYKCSNGGTFQIDDIGEEFQLMPEHCERTGFSITGTKYGNCSCLPMKEKE